jgi:NAD(P)-dependent dehydrogenase (short-subunit alcohol dehydrogenase family)
MMTEGYSTSKAALDMLTVIQSQRLKDKKIAVAAAHPGWVKTELGGEGATMEIADGASTVVTLATQPRATFPHAQLVHRGDRLPW